MGSTQATVDEPAGPVFRAAACLVCLPLNPPGSRARLLALTHFSQRYDRDGIQRLAGQAETAFGGPVVLARIPVPSRHPAVQ
jgi:hypothetical protein